MRQNRHSLYYSRYFTVNTGMVNHKCIKAKLYGQHFLATYRAIMLQLQAAIVCCPYYYPRTQQIFILQEVDTVSTFCNMKTSLNKWMIIAGIYEFSYTAVSRKVVQLKSIKAYATILKDMMGCGCSLLHRSSSSRVFSAMEGGAMNTCLRVLKETNWILSF